MGVGMMECIAIIVIDMQTSLVEGNPYHRDILIENIRSLIDMGRKKNMAVIYIRHHGKSSGLVKNSDGWQIYKALTPQNDEKIFDKQYNSAFKNTRLKQYLEEKKIKNLILVGMQTEYCIDVTCKVAFEYGFKIVIPEDAISTYDNSWLSGKQLNEYYTQRIWNHCFANVLSTQEILKSAEKLFIK